MVLKVRILITYLGFLRRLNKYWGQVNMKKVKCKNKLGSEIIKHT